MTAATPTTMADLFTTYYTDNPITDTVVLTDFNDTINPTYADITADSITDYNQQIAVSNYSQALTLSTDDSETTQWGLSWSLVLQSTTWTATSTQVYTQYFAPKYATDSEYANYVCKAVNVDDSNGDNVLANDADVTTTMQVTGTNWETNFGANIQLADSDTVTSVTA